MGGRRPLLGWFPARGRVVDDGKAPSSKEMRIENRDENKIGFVLLASIVRIQSAYIASSIQSDSISNRLII